MNRKEFDKILGDRLRNSEAPVNPKLWDNIANALDNEKKAGFLPWFSANMILLFFITGLGAVGAFYYRNEIKLLLNDKKTSFVAESKMNSTSSTGALNSNNVNSNSLSASAISSVNINDKIQATLNTANKPQLEKNKTTQQSNKNLSLKTRSFIPDNNLSSLNQLSPKLNIQSANENELVLTLESNNNFTKLNILDKIPTSNESYLVNNELTTLGINKIGPKKRPKCPRFYSTAPRYSFTFYGGPNLFTKKLEIDNKEFAGLKPAREQTETGLIGSTFGFYADVTFRNKFILRSGLNYFIAREKFRFVNEGEEIIKSKVIVSDTIQGTDGKTYLQLDTLFYSEKGTRVRQSANSFRVIEMPLLAGIQFDRGRWYGTVIGGLLLQLYQVNEGLILDKNTIEPVAFSSTSNTGQYFRNSWGLGLYASLQLGYRLDDAYSLIFEPNLRYYPGNAHIDGYPLIQTNTIFGTNLGIRYTF